MVIPILQKPLHEHENVYPHSDSNNPSFIGSIFYLFIVSLSTLLSVYKTGFTSITKDYQCQYKYFIVI